MAKKRIVIVGAGFSGLLAAKRLAQRLANSAEVVLINKGTDFLFAPRLIDLLQDRIDDLPYRSDLKRLSERYGFRFIQATVNAIDRHAKEISYSEVNGSTQALSYDIIVLSPGATTNYYNTPGAKEFAIDLKTYDSVLRIRERIVSLFERAATVNDAQKRMLLCFSVIGAGASGIEAMFALKLHIETYAAAHAPEYTKFLSFILVQAAPQILPGFPDAVVDGAAMQILREGVSLFVGEPVTNVTADGFDTVHGRMVPSGLVLWCAGIAPQPLAITPDVAKDPAGFFITDHALRIDEHTFAAGDAVSFKHNLVVVPKNGQTARQMAFTITENVLRTLSKRPMKHFHYYSKGSIVIVGKTGFLDLHFLVIKNPLMLWFRDIFYKMIYAEIAT